MPLYYPTPLAAFINVKDPAYGAKGDGSTDDTTAISAALTAANNAGGGIVFFPKGTYITGNQTLYPYVSLLGSGITATTIRLKASANTDLFSAQTSSINLSASTNSGSAGTLLNFSIQNLTLDGNKANQSSGTSYPLRFYGYNFILRDLEILNGYTGGSLIDWNGGGALSSPSDQMESTIDTCKFHDNNGIGLQMGGPHDSRLHNVVAFSNGSHNFHFAPNATGILGTNCHAWGEPNTTNVCGYLVEGEGCNFTNCIAEGSHYCNLALIASNVVWVGGSIYGTSADWTNEVGVQVGQQAGQTPFPGQINQSAGLTTAIQAQYCMICTTIIECRGGAISELNSSNNTFICNVFQQAGTALTQNYPASSTDTFILSVAGLTPDGTAGKGGTFQMGSAAYSGVIFFDSAGNQLFEVNTWSGNGEGFNLLNGNLFTGFSDNGVTAQYQFNAANGDIQTNGQFATGQSASAAALASNGTITTANTGVSRVAPTGTVTGVILQAGTVAGQQCVVVNESTNSVTFAAVATSHVADGTSAIISANRCMFFVWDSSTSKWYHS